jgi:hypothetical protein
VGAGDIQLGSTRSPKGSCRRTAEPSLTPSFLQRNGKQGQPGQTLLPC